jgi:cytochrome c oxidase subunit 2
MGFIVIACLILLGVIVVQVGQISEISKALRGEEQAERRSNDISGRWLVIFMVVFLIACIWSFKHYKPVMLGFAGNEASSAHGGLIDSMFNVTLVITGIVFFITQILTFWFSYRFRERDGVKALFYPHNNTLEVVWMAIPAVAMSFLVVKGLIAWNGIMADIPKDAKPLGEVTEEMLKDKNLGKTHYIEVESTGQQFAWILRHPGKDGLLGERNYRIISSDNDLGQVWTDTKNHDDIKPDELVLPKGIPVRVRITAKDVLHNFYLPQFRVKMDAIPGLPTYFVFTPIETTEERRAELSAQEHWNTPADPKDPENTKKRWETFNFELACAELCGKGHFSMRRVVKIVTLEEYKKWLDGQQSFYSQNVKGTPNDTSHSIGTTENTSTDVQSVSDKAEQHQNAQPGI